MYSVSPCVSWNPFSIYKYVSGFRTLKIYVLETCLNVSLLVRSFKEDTVFAIKETSIDYEVFFQTVSSLLCFLTLCLDSS